MRKHVLLCIDDEPMGLDIRRLLLESAGYRVVTASSGPEGLEAFRRNAIDAVVLDYFMPDLDGQEVARHMRQEKPAVPIVLLSAYPSLPHDLIVAVDACVTKGQPPDVLLAELAQLLQHPAHAD
jgi:CheY-like chemotaxis protein